MAQRRNTALTRLRGRPWRLTALVLWAVIMLGNLGAAWDVAAASLANADDLHSMCLASGGPDAPAPTDTAPSPAHSGAPHCALCYVFAAGQLAPPATTQILVLAPQSGWSGPGTDVLAPPRPPVTAFAARPRAPPAFV